MLKEAGERVDVPGAANRARRKGSCEHSPTAPTKLSHSLLSLIDQLNFARAQLTWLWVDLLAKSRLPILWRRWRKGTVGGTIGWTSDRRGRRRARWRLSRTGGLSLLSLALCVSVCVRQRHTRLRERALSLSSGCVRRRGGCDRIRRQRVLGRHLAVPGEQMRVEIGAVSACVLNLTVAWKRDGKLGTSLMSSTGDKLARSLARADPPVRRPVRPA